MSIVNKDLSGALWKSRISIYLFVVLLACRDENEESLISYVDPLIGTAVSTTESARKHSEAGSELRGQTFPAVGVPHGMTHWTPQTQATERKCIAPYYHEDDSIQGFRGSHWLSGSCTQDYGSVTIMPTTGRLVIQAKGRASRFSHESEIARPDYYRVNLIDYSIDVELTATSRCGLFRMRTANSSEVNLIIEPNSDEGEGYVEIIPERNEIVGYNPVHRIYQGWGKEAGFSGYFVFRFDAPLKSYGTWKGDSLINNSTKASGAGNNIGAFVTILKGNNNEVLVKTGTSFTSVEAARTNLDKEIPSWDFESTRTKTSMEWDDMLSKFQINQGTKESKTLFYTALYHANLVPRTMNDVDGTYPAFSQHSKTEVAKGFTYYDDYSLWDTHRAVHPLLTITAPDRTEDMVRSLVKKYEQGGWLPIFPCWNSYTAAMVGDHGTAMIADALMKNIGMQYAENAYAAMRKNAFEVNNDEESYADGKGRRGLQSYIEYNFIPLEDSVWEAFHKREQVSRTLEYAYDDYALSQVAKKLGMKDDYNKLINCSKNYINVFDTVSGFVRGRYKNGKWIEPFDPNAQRAPFITEGSPSQYTWFIPHDIPGLIQLMGGDARFIERLDALFEEGHYWHGNEPGHHTAYLYSYAGAPWKQQKLIHDIIKNEYSVSAGGLSGNEDAGQMSAWLVFSMVGFYPVCPSEPYYVLGSPSFPDLTIRLPNERTFRIVAKNLDGDHIFISSAILNGKPFNRSYLLHDEIMEGGTLELVMSKVSNQSWATEPDDRPGR
jgi:predicted alpha-1,2-mannosidase